MGERMVDFTERGTLVMSPEGESVGHRMIVFAERSCLPSLWHFRLTQGHRRIQIRKHSDRPAADRNKCSIKHACEGHERRQSLTATLLGSIVVTMADVPVHLRKTHTALTLERVLYLTVTCDPLMM